jgi:hypothetical protein
VACTDSDNPETFAAWSTAADEAEDDYGYFGPIWTWASSACAVWPGSRDSRYAGPFTAETANPVLVVGTVYDPATRYQGAVKVASLLPNSQLVTVNGWGHTSLFLSQCADHAVSDYLLTGTPPAADPKCSQDLVPFIDFYLAGATPAAAEGRARVLPILLPEAVRQGVR